MPKDHATLSASGSARWIACPPSAKLEEKFPQETSTYAEEGTAAHALAEIEAKVILDQLSPSDYLAQKRELQKSPYYNEEMQSCAENYAAFVMATLEKHKETCPDAFAELEVKLSFTKWVPQGFGTGDCIIVSDDTLEVIDLKYGKGVKVEAENNSQMMLYALGAIAEYESLYDIEKVKMTIYQPRLAGTHSTWEIPIKDLLAWAKKVVKPAAKLAWAGEGEFAPSLETCRFCRAKAQCRARADYNLKAFDEAQDPLLISPDEAGEILKKTDDIEAWLKDLKELVTSTLLGGDPVKDWKLVEGRSVRKITDELKAADALRDAGYPDEIFYERKFLSLTALEKNLGAKTVKETLGDLVVKPKGSPTLAPATDKRPEWVPEEAILEAFDE